MALGLGSNLQSIFTLNMLPKKFRVPGWAEPKPRSRSSRGRIVPQPRRRCETCGPDTAPTGGCLRSQDVLKGKDAPALRGERTSMRFVDEAVITVKAGKGGNGCLSFRREKFMPKGGPDGGNGGDGGSVYARGVSRLLSLYDFRLKRLYEAQNGQGGMGSQCDGRKGEDLVLELPLGTQLYERTEEGEALFADLSDPDALVPLARGGRGGKGNEHFKSSTMRAPRFAQKGEPGEERSFRLELKILADAGLLGLPNAGKSTFLSRVSAARPKIADYPFTTLTPNLGVLIDEYDPDHRMVIADIPGLIEGAHAGQGLGDRFLRHVERTRFLVHILSVEDVQPDGENPWAGFDLINEELALFDPELARRRQIEVINKIDLRAPEELDIIRARAEADGRRMFFISARDGEGLEELTAELWRLRDELDRHEALVRFAEEEEEAGEFPEIEVEWVRE